MHLHAIYILHAVYMQSIRYLHILYIVSTFDELCMFVLPAIYYLYIY